MHRSLLLALIFTAGILITGARAARAQTDESGWEAGGHVTAIDFNNDSPLTNSPGTTFESSAYPTAYGFGGRVGYNVNSNFAVEAEVNYFPTDRFAEGGRKVQGLFGVKAGRRFGRVIGVFAKARPGFLKLGPAVTARTPALGDTRFALDLGGVVELYPSRRSIVRVDVGDTIIPLGDTPINSALRPPQSFGTTHNKQTTFGIGYRF